MQNVFERHATEVVQTLEHAAGTDAVVDVQDLMYQFTLHSIGEIGFGVRIQDEGVATAFDRAQQIAFERVTKPAFALSALRPLYKLFSASERELRGHVAKLNSFAYDVIRQRS